MVNMGNVWDRTTEFLSDNLGAILPLALITIFVPQSISGAIRQAGAAVNPALAQGIALALLLPIIWGQLTITALALQPEAGRGAARSVATRRFGQAVLAGLIAFCVIVLLFLPIVFVLAASGVDLAALAGKTPAAAPDMAPGTGAFIILYFLAWMVFAIFASIRFTTLLLPVVVAEGGVVRALRRSFAVSNGIAWKLLGVAILFVVVVIVAWLAVTSVFGTLFRFLDPDAGPFSVGSIVVAVLGALVTTMYYVLQSAFMAKVYRSATAAREAA
jgi:hypothetical protein